MAGCSYDYMEDTEIYPDSRKVGFIGRATFQLNPDNQLFAELVQTRDQDQVCAVAEPGPHPQPAGQHPAGRPTATR